MKRIILLIFLLLLAACGLLFQRYRRFAAQPRPLTIVTPDRSQAATPSPAATVPVHLDSALPGAELHSTAALTVALAQRYPGWQRRFPHGVQLTLVATPQAPEPLRGPYDPDPTSLLLGAVYPLPQEATLLPPEAEAWAGCRRDLELGPAPQLRCYLYVRGAAGPTLDGLAVLAWVQALDVALSARAQDFDPTTIPLLTATEEAGQWRTENALLSLSFSP